jgi:hypothetical protein
MATVETDQDLLFGRMPLQNSLIERPDLIAAFQCWMKLNGNAAGHIMSLRRGETEARQFSRLQKQSARRFPPNPDARVHLHTDGLS